MLKLSNIASLLERNSELGRQTAGPRPLNSPSNLLPPGSGISSRVREARDPADPLPAMVKLTCCLGDTSRP
jgi:hypothetical protein